MKSYRYHSLILVITFLLLSLLCSLAVTRVDAVSEKGTAQIEEKNGGHWLDKKARNNLWVDLLSSRATFPAFTKGAGLEPVVPMAMAGLTFTVNSTADPGSGICDANECTLREAITAANAAAGSDTIVFDIPNLGPHTITPTTALPSITSPVVIDGYTQPGASANSLADDDNAVLMIELNGSVATAAGALNLIHINAGSSTIRGLVINRCSRAIAMDTNGGNVIEGNFIGTNVAGSAVLLNDYGVLVNIGSSNNLIGGTTPGARNLISGNNFGVGLQGGPSTVQGNFIGTDRAGINDLGNSIGVSITASNGNTIGGTAAGARNVISGNANGVRMQANNNVVQGNYIGVNASGGAFTDTNTIGVVVFGSGNTVGGITSAARNVISGHNIGVSINADSTTVQGNYIGTDAAGTAALGNTTRGISMIQSNNSLIGGTAPGAGNLISANGIGIEFSPSTTGITIQIQGNLIGTNVNGTGDLGNTGDGISINDAAARAGTNITIGGTAAGARNVISGNNGDGIDLRSVTGVVVQGNLIGTQTNGTSPLGNSGHGVNILSATNNAIGGTAPGAGNRIGFNGAGLNAGGGIILEGFGVTNNPLRGNSIFRNTSNGTVANRGLGIDLSLSGSGNGPTTNESCDGDTGPNNLQNFPMVTSAITSGGGTTIQGTLDSTAATTFTIDLYSSASPDPSGYGEGETYLGSTTATSSGGCSYTFSFTTSSPLANTQVVTATATDPNGNTSEFSGFVTVTVNANDAPSFTKGTDQTVNEDAGAQGVPNWATNISPGGGPDEAGQTLNFVVTNDNNSLFSAQPAISSAGTLTYTPASDTFGFTTVTVQLHDNGGMADGGQDTSASQTFTITVNAVNDAPSFTKGPDQTLDEDAGAQSVSNWATNIFRGGGTSEAGQTVNFMVTNDNNSLFSTQPAISDTGTLTYIPAPDAFGVTTVTLQLHDNGGTVNGGQDTSAGQSFTITINAVNDPPSFTKGPNQSVPKGSGAQVVPNWATNISPGPANELAQTMTLLVQDNTNPALFSAGPAISSTGTLTYTPAANASGTATITVALMDNGGGADTSTAQTFVISVTDANDAPDAVNDLLPSVAEDSGARTIAITSLLSNDSAGPPDESGQTLSFSLVAASEVGGTVSSDATNVYFTPAANNNGPVSFQYRVTDNGTTNGAPDPKSDTATVNFTVTEVNDAPEAVNDPLGNMAEDSGVKTIPFSALTGNDSKGPANENGQTLTVKTVSDAVGGTVSIAGNTVRFTPAVNFNGFAHFDYTVEDSGTTNGAPDPKTSAPALAHFHITAVADTPSVTNATSNANTQTTSGLVISRNPLDGPEVTHFKITGITGGSLFKNDGTTPISNGDFITFAEGNAGLKFTPGTSNGSFTVQASLSVSDAGLGGGTATAIIAINAINALTGIVRFSAANYSVAEGAGFKVITVERTGDTSRSVTVDYASSDHSDPPNFIPCTSPGAGLASSRCDFTTAVGRLRFAPGETSKTFNVLISQDNYVEGQETLVLTLSNLTGGAVFGVPSTAVLEIVDDATEEAPNPIDASSDFVRQEYHDMLNREPDAPGLAFWTDNIEKCHDPAKRPPLVDQTRQTVAECIDKQRESTAVAFFMSPEFQMTGGFVYRLYKGSLTGAPNYDGGSPGSLPGRFPTFLEFMFDLSQVSEGILVNNQIDGAVLEANRNRLAAEFAQRPEFLEKYGGLNDTLYVQELFNTTGITPEPADKQALINGLMNGTETRASVLRKVVDGTVVISEGNLQFTTTYGQAFHNQEYRRVFVYMEYVGYLRRNPDSAGLIHWLVKLNQYNSDPFRAEMVRSFILSPEYRSRFGTP